MGKFPIFGANVTDGQADSSLAARLFALSFAAGLALRDRMEHGIGSA